MQQFHIRGVSIAADIQGISDRSDSTELIVFIHGVGADRTCWKHQLPFFASHGYAAATLDMRGSGDSTARLEGGEVVTIDREQFARDTDAVIRELGFERAHWVGNSMGGVIILEALGLGLSSLGKIVLSNTFAKHPDSAEILPRPSRALASRSLEDFARERIPPILRPGIDPETLNEAIHAMARKDVEAYLASWRATWSPDWRELLPRVRNPTLVIASEDDRITPLPLSQELAHGIPGARLAIVPNAGHLPNLDRPEEFNRIVLEFLQQ